ncbi:hypothetical protein R6Q59_006688 [Mikania micrantha]
MASVLQCLIDVVEIVGVLVNTCHGARRRYNEFEEANPNFRKFKRVISVCTSFVLIYLLVGALILNSSHISINNIEMQGIYVNQNTTDGILSLLGEIHHHIRFSDKGMHKAYLESVNYTMSVFSATNISLSAVSTAAFSSTNKQQLLVANFETKRLGLTVEQLRNFQNRIDKGYAVVDLEAHFKWVLKLTRLLKYPYVHRYVSFRCQAQYVGYYHLNSSCII